MGLLRICQSETNVSHTNKYHQGKKRLALHSLRSKNAPFCTGGPWLVGPGLSHPAELLLFPAQISNLLRRLSLRRITPVRSGPERERLYEISTDLAPQDLNDKSPRPTNHRV